MSGNREILIHERNRGTRDYEVTFEFAEITYRNFEGREDKFNKAGDRNFALFIPEDYVDEAKSQGWNVKRQKEYDGVPGRPWLPVHVGFKIRPPRMVMLTETTRRRTILDQDTCYAIDQANISFVDVTIRPVAYEVNGNKGIKIWLDSIFVMLRENYLDLKYADWDEKTGDLTAGPVSAMPAYDWKAEVQATQDGITPLEPRR